MKKILMYLNIPWEFIKQRPQFLAEKINMYMEVVAYYNKPYKNKYLVHENQVDDKVYKVKKRKIPRKNALLRSLDNKLQHIFLRKHIKDKDFIWIMHPDQYEIIKSQIGNQKLIYDCMDDYSQFPHLSELQSQRLQEIEKDLVARADYIFYTSKTLKDNIMTRYKKQSTNSYIINNAFEPNSEYTEDKIISNYMRQIPTKKLVYIGAIAPWFDFKVIQQILEADKSVSMVLFGPVDIEIPQLDRLYHYGKIPHESIYTAMREADALMMPFKINNLVLAVDPIKIYEYIYSGKQVIVPYYPEMDKFKQYVSVYHTCEEAIEIVKHLNKGNDEKIIKDFMQNNTWEARARQIAQILGIDEKESTFN